MTNLKEEITKFEDSLLKNDLTELEIKDAIINMLIDKLSTSESLLERIRELLPYDNNTFDEMYDGLGLYDFAEQLSSILYPNNIFIIHDDWNGEE